MRFVLVRHCETDWNAEGRHQGHTDIPLNARGIAQADVLAKSLGTESISRILSSTLRRAAETATIIGARLRLPVRHDDRLRECCFGSLEGKTGEEIEAELCHPVFSSHEPYDYRPYGGEYFADVLARHQKALDNACASAPEEGATLIIGHGCGLNTLLHHRGEPPTLHRGEFRRIVYIPRRS